MYFGDYKQHTEAKINQALLWEYDMSAFDFGQMANIVVQRVVERGWPDDWYAALNLYSVDGMKEIIKALPYLNEKDMYFVSGLFEIPLSQMKCYTKKQSQQLHWNS